MKYDDNDDFCLYLFEKRTISFLSFLKIEMLNILCLFVYFSYLLYILRWATYTGIQGVILIANQCCFASESKLC